ncbi:hypothetical protein HK414_24700 [Ramlibacter terrae]|uniref:BPP domain-containing protein n=1 Tax=Ramlibacter terrae TaxID=2732511 RepID=A0ABX6P5Q0_9BURK|nr:hypothetical protein HK414_24700 [Ramlibacter terrae]
MMEVLIPLAVPVADADAAANMAQTMASPGSREGLLDGPVCAAVTAAGHVLVLEQGNNRIQALDTGGSAARLFGGNTSAAFALKPRTAVDYLDLAVEHTGYIYVLVRDRDSGGVLALDLYTPDGQFPATTNRVNAGKVGIDLFRNAYTLNYEPMVGGNYVEPSVSFWTPGT